MLLKVKIAFLKNRLQSKVCELIRQQIEITNRVYTIKIQPKLIKKGHKYNSKDLNLAL
jgi:succinylglutamate desuccinylase